MAPLHLSACAVDMYVLSVCVECMRCVYASHSPALLFLSLICKHTHTHTHTHTHSTGRSACRTWRLYDTITCVISTRHRTRCRSLRFVQSVHVCCVCVRVCVCVCVCVCPTTLNRNADPLNLNVDPRQDTRVACRLVVVDSGTDHCTHRCRFRARNKCSGCSGGRGSRSPISWCLSKRF